MIGVDWGTTQLRAYRIDASGVAIAARSAPKGILSVADGRFDAALESVIADWLDAEPGPVVMAGMIGSRQGWVEAPYVACPATAAEIAGRLAEVRWGAGRRGFICPGMTCRDPDGVPDVMRGEEVQAIGVLALEGNGVGAIRHPGTHSKHVRIADGAIAGFATFLTGEMFAVLRDHSILGRTMTEGPVDWGAFADGLDRAGQSGGLLHHLFGARTRALLGGLGSASGVDYLSGMLIGHELLAEAGHEPVVIVGAPDLAQRYARAYRAFGRQARILSAEAATAAGLRRIWDLAAGAGSRSG